MKPFELIAALMAQEGGSLPLAKKMGKPQWQSKIYKFANGQVKNPEAETAMGLAAYFKIPLEAIYDERVATRVATERGISALPAQIKKSTERKPEKTAEEKEAESLAARYLKMTPAERQHLRLLMLAAVEAKHPPAEKWRAPGRPEVNPRDRLLGGDSGLGN
jgi:transcriptional regulator with XRE-family HTH domain